METLVDLVLGTTRSESNTGAPIIPADRRVLLRARRTRPATWGPSSAAVLWKAHALLRTTNSGPVRIAAWARRCATISPAGPTPTRRRSSTSTVARTILMTSGKREIFFQRHPP